MEHQTFIDLETYDMKPINISPEFEHPQIITAVHPPSSEVIIILLCTTNYFFFFPRIQI
jgi:hypothetical protein